MLPTLAANFDGSVESPFLTMFTPFIADTVKDSNRRIISHNIQFGLTPNDTDYVHLLSFTECINFLGLVVLIDLQKTDSRKTRKFIRKEYTNRAEHLFDEVGLLLHDNNQISYRRFLKISKFIHYGNPFRWIDKNKWKKSDAVIYQPDGGYWELDININTGRPKRVLDMLHAYENAIQKLNQIFMSYCTLEAKLSLDEIMTHSRSRECPMISYNAGKRHKRGVCYYLLNLDKTYYTVKITPLWPGYQKPPSIRPVLGLIKFMTNEIQNTNCTIVIDNFYCTVTNSKALLDRGLFTLGTVQYNRIKRFINIPKVTPKGDNFSRHIQVYAIKYNGSVITVSAYFDKEDSKICVLLCTSNNLSFGTYDAHFHHKRPNIFVTGGLHSRLLDLFERPHIYHIYNRTMCPTDINDYYQHKSSLGILYKTVKFWSRRIYLGLFTMALINSYIKYVELANDKMSYTTFRYRFGYFLIMFKHQNYYTPAFSIDENRKNVHRFRCGHCNPTFTHLQKLTKQKCNFCRNPACENHLLQLCHSCCSDLQNNAVSPIILRNFENKRKKCRDHNCTSKTDQYCALLFQTSFSNLYLVLTVKK